MSIPFGPSGDIDRMSLAAQLRAFNKVIREYALARSQANDRESNFAKLEGDAAREEHQRLADAAQHLFVAGEKLKAYAMVLAGNGVFVTSAELADDAALVASGMAGPY